MFSDAKDLKEASKWDGKGLVSRQKLVEELQSIVSLGNISGLCNITAFAVVWCLLLDILI